MCDPEGTGWGVEAPVKTAAVFLGAAVEAPVKTAAVFLGAAVAAVVLAGVARLWLPLAVGAGGVAVLTAGAVWGLHARFMVVWCEADPVPARVAETQAALQMAAEPATLTARTYRQLPVGAPAAGARRVVPGVVLPAK